MPARDKVEEEEPRGPGCLVTALRFFNTVLVVAFIAYVAAFAAARTDGFKGLVKERLEDQLGLKVSIGKVASDWRGNLTLSAVDARTTNESSRQGARMETIGVDWDLAASFRGSGPRIARITCDGGSIVLEREGSAWVPANLAGFGDWVAAWLKVPVGNPSNVEAAVVAADSAWAGTSVLVSNVDVAWVTSGTGVLAEVRGLAVESMPLATPKRYLRHFSLAALYAEGPGMQVRNADIEWIDTGATNVILSFREERSVPDAPGY